MVKKMCVSILVALGCVQCLNGCFPKVVPYEGKAAFRSESGHPIYSELEYWAAHPDKWDPSDSMQNKLTHDNGWKEIDVFFLYPTSYTDELQKGQSNNAKIDDPYINKKTDYTSILYQASVFNKSCNVYAPRYRQAHISMYYNQDSVAVRNSFDTAYTDIRNAFTTYIEKFNNGRPFIIASHSQGTTHAARLLKDEIFQKYLPQLVAAYLVGMPVPRNIFKNIGVCEDTVTTGCFTSWRTYQKGYQNEYISLEDNQIAVVNPLNWKTDTTMATRKQHNGAILYNFQKVIRNTHDAQVRGNALFISKPRFPGSVFINMKNYHAGDYNLFYVNIREDVERRISYYKKKRYGNNS